MTLEREPHSLLRPTRLLDNEHSILDITDLVFVDPVSTGFSRAQEDKKKGEFHGLEGDIESVGAFIHQFCSKHGRWDSPKYLIGESYGGIRAAGLAAHLQDRYGMYLNGIVLVSAVLDFTTILFNEGNDLPYFAVFTQLRGYGEVSRSDSGRITRGSLSSGARFRVWRLFGGTLEGQYAGWGNQERNRREIGRVNRTGGR